MGAAALGWEISAPKPALVEGAERFGADPPAGTGLTPSPGPKAGADPKPEEEEATVSV